MDLSIGPNDTKTENGSPEKDEDSESLDVGELYLDRRNVDSCCEYT